MKIVIPGTPIAKKRPRFARTDKGVRTYNSQETEEGKFLLLAREQVGEMIDRDPVRIAMVFYIRRPKCHYGTGSNAGKLKLSAPKFPAVKPDLDNLEKFALDALNGVAWMDDSQIVSSVSRKEYSENPRTEIYIERLEVT